MTTEKKYLRRGYTTGSCAAAAAKAATLALVTQMPVTATKILLPNKNIASFFIQNCSFDTSYASCSVKKDAGDDPDITDGIEIIATIKRTQSKGISISGGKGVGTVTKPGLDIEIGKSAINPVPHRMIKGSVSEIIREHAYEGGLEIIISVPAGEEIADRTFNSRLGIRGGISIIGTSGMVIPYSTRAYTASIARMLDVAKACNCDKVVFSTGRRSEKYAQEVFKFPVESFILTGDYIGYALKQTARKGIKHAVIWGMIGKISKLAAGNMYTNVSDSHVDIAMMLKLAEDCGVPDNIMGLLGSSVTANQVRKLLPDRFIRPYCNRLAEIAAVRCRAGVGNKIEVDCIISDPAGLILGRSDDRE